MELKKVGAVYCNYEQLQKTLIGRLNWHKNDKKEIFYNWRIETNLGVNFIVQKTIKNLNNKKNYFWDIFGINAAALKKFELHTNLTPLSINELNALKGGAPYQVFKGV